MRRLCVTLFLAVIAFDAIVCPPVTPKKEEPPKKEDEDDGDADGDAEDDAFGLEYERYLKEVVSVLESDDTFRKKLEESNVSEIKSGEIARHLEFVSHGIRTKLDELKRKEIDRLRQVMKMQQHLERGMPLGQIPVNPAALVQGFKQMGRELNLPRVEKEAFLAHVDHKNPNTFEIDDLAKLIKQATQDLEDLDKKRREEFKTYEMEKERERRDHLAKLNDEEQRKKEEQEYEEMKKKHAEHPKVHHPGNREQLEEVWEEADGMDKDSFDPKTFFYMHDTNNDNMLDEAEVEALFTKELDKVYDPENPEDDMVERDEEMNRMREHVFGEVDKNQDKFISLEEFLQNTNSDEFDKDEDWKTLDEEEPYEDEEIEQYIREYEENQRKALEAQGHQLPVDPSQQPPVVQDNALHFQGQGQDHLQGQGQVQGQGVQQMHQQPPVPANGGGQPPADNIQQPNQPPQEPNQPDQNAQVVEQQQNAQQQVAEQQQEQQQQIEQNAQHQVEQQQVNQNAQQQVLQEQQILQEPIAVVNQSLQNLSQQQQQQQQINNVPVDVAQQQAQQQVQQDVQQPAVVQGVPDQPQA